MLNPKLGQLHWVYGTMSQYNTSCTYVCMYIYIYSFLQKIIYAFTYTYSTVSWLRKEMYKERLPKKVPKKAAHPQKVNEDSRGFEGTDVGGTTVNNIYIYILWPPQGRAGCLPLCFVCKDMGGPAVE